MEARSRNHEEHGVYGRIEARKGDAQTMTGGRKVHDRSADYHARNQRGQIEVNRNANAEENAAGKQDLNLSMSHQLRAPARQH